MTDSSRTTDDTVQLQTFRRLALITICAVYFLILVGATVRASGAGMGCPDWPTCFGSWIPPISEAQLPENYQEIYADRGYAETRFNPVKTWTEYLNRLVGVTIGLLILMTAIKSLSLRHHDRWITIASVAALLMVIYQGWLGSRVVASNLQPGMITLHMLMALAIVGTLLFALARARRGVLAAQSLSLPPGMQRWLYLVLALTVLQVAMGTQVREMVDFLNHTQGEERSAWVSALPWFFYVHRTFSAVVLFANVWLVWMFYQALGLGHSLTRLALGMLAVVVLAIISGATLGHLGMPAVVQPTHLLTASLIFGLQFLLWMDYRHARGA
ncbi:MAG: heme A synthase [Gammaproteobacteria bacterium]|nr:heme A synthase [Gammaproteobacteria bacterium]|tara:strand:+ start:7452 stop:8435 length:984 start_codon:yes stop_codon:yes gene_type:complete